MGTNLKGLYLKFYASLHHYYMRRDSTPGVFVFFTSTILIGFNVLFAYDFLQYYFFNADKLSQPATFGMVAIIGILNYLLVIRKGEYREVYPSKSFQAGVIIYIIVSLLLMFFIAFKYRTRMLPLKPISMVMQDGFGIKSESQLNAISQPIDKQISYFYPQ